MAAPVISAFKVTVGTTDYIGTISGKAISVEVPYGTSVSALKTTLTATGATAIKIGGASGTSFTNGDNVSYVSCPVQFYVTDGTDADTYNVTVTVDEESVMSVEDIYMAGWSKVKIVKLKDFDYSAGGFVSPYKACAVLAVNSATVTGGYVYDSSGTQKVKLFSGTSEASGELTADVYLLLK